MKTVASAAEPDNGLPQARWQISESAEILARIFAAICDASVPGGGGAVSWRGHDDQTSQTVSLGPHLYDGSCGTALFLGAYYLSTGDKRARDLALRGMAQLRLKIASLAENAEKSQPRSLAIGGMTGLGGILYTFVKLSSWLHEPTLMESAHLTAVLITSERISKDEKFDVVGGCAGALLGLLVLAATAEQERALELAILCGRRLVQEQKDSKLKAKAWYSNGSQPLCGFAHGASGIAYSLIRLFRCTGRSEFMEAALEGFAFERNSYDPEAHGWLDLRFNRLHEQQAWCHGAPGVTLARLGAMPAMADNSIICHDLEEALTVTMALEPTVRDHLCCGNFGRIEVLHVAGLVLQRPELIKMACELAQQRLLHAKNQGFCFCGENPDDCQTHSHPGLFTGLSGVGYALMRLNYPNLLPCVLMLE